MINRRQFTLGAAGLAGLSAMSLPRMARAGRADRLNILCWEGYNSDQVLNPFRELHPGATVRAESGTSDPEMINRLRAGEIGTWDLINVNNASANRPGKHQYVLLMEGKHVPAGYESAARALRGNRKLTPAQQLNIELNLQLIEMQAALSEKETANADDDTTFA